MAPVMAVPQRTPRRSASHLVLVATAGVALAGKFLSGVVNSSAFVGNSGVPVTRRYEGRQVEVYREIKAGAMPRFAKDAIFEDLKKMSSEELRNVISLSSEYHFRHRMAVFAKTKPPRRALTEMHYKLVAAKTLIRQRELEVEKKAAEEAEPEEPETYAEMVARTFDYERASKAFSMRPGQNRAGKTPVSRTRADGMRNRNVAYYNKPGFSPPGPNRTAPWEAGVRVRQYNKEKFRGRKNKHDIFRTAKRMPGMIPPSGVM